MGRILTTLALVLAVILAAALIVPAATDWEEERASLETRLAEIVGGPVELAGPVSVRLLPSPRLTAARVSFQDAAARLQVDGASLHAEMALWPLFVNRVVVTQVALEGGEVRFHGDAASARALADELAARMSIGAGEFNYVIAPDRVILGDGERAVELPAVSVNAEWAGTDTPVRLTLRSGEDLRADGVLRPQADGSWRINLRANYREDVAEFSAGGELRRMGAGAPFAGNFSLDVDDTHALLGLEGEGPAFSLRGPFQAAGPDWVTETAQLTLGTMQAATEIRGTTTPHLSLRAHLSSALADLDALGFEMAPIRDALTRAMFGGAPSPVPAWLEGGLTLRAEGLVLNDRVTRNAIVSLQSVGGNFYLDGLGGRFPGGTDIQLAPRRDPARGLMVESESLRSLMTWLGVDVSAYRNDKLQAFGLNLAISESAAPLRLSIFNLELDGGRAEGALTFDEDGAMSVTMNAEGFDLDAYAPEAGGSFLSRLRHFAGLAGGRSGAAFNLTGEDVRLAGGAVDRFRFAAAASEGGLAIEEAEIAFANGGTLSAAGSWAAGGEAFDLEIEGADVDPGLFEGLALAPTAPADLSLTLGRSAGRITLEGNVETQGLGLDLVGTEVDDGVFEGRMIARGQEQGALATALGLDVFATREGAELLDLQWAGPLESGDLTARLELAGFSALARGPASQPFSDHPQADLTAGFTARSVSDVIRQAGGPSIPDLESMSLSGEGHVRRTETGWRIVADVAHVGDVPVSFDLRNAEGGMIQGDITLERLDLFTDAEANEEDTETASSDESADAAARLAWSTSPFALDWMDDAHADLAVGISALQMGRAAFKDVGFRLAFSGGGIAVEEARGTIGSGVLTGSATMLRDDTALDITADFAGEGVPAGTMARATNLPPLEGGMTMAAQFSTRGRSPFDLVAGLQGRINVEMGDGAFSSVDMGHLEQALPDVRTRRGLRGAANEAVAQGQTDIARLDGPVSVTRGVFDLSGLTGVAETGGFTVDGSLDLRSQIVDVITTFQITDAEAGATPVTVAFRGAGGALSTTIDITALQDAIGARLADTPQGLLSEDDLPEDLQELLRSYEASFPDEESEAASP